LEVVHRPISDVYFPLRGIISVVAATSDRRHETEVALIGQEGMTGTPIVLGAHASLWTATVLIEGEGFCIGAAEFVTLLRESATLRLSLLRHVQALLAQLAHSVLASAKGKIQARLARWLLMAQDRMGTNELKLTHEFLALILGVRRAGVTLALDTLESQRLLSRRRGNIVITDRPGLKAASDGLYGTPEREIARLLDPRSVMSDN
jgi:CRP-like cAMP-binding protein